MSHTTPAPRRSWPWVVLVVVVVAAIIVGISLLSRHLAGAPAASAAPTRTAVATATPAAGAEGVTGSATPRAGLSRSAVATIEGAIEDGDPSELFDELSSPVHVQFAASDFDSNRSRANAVTDLAYVNGLTGWNWDVDAATLAAFRAGVYKDDFPANALVGTSAEGYVISFTVTTGRVSSIFVSKSVALVTATTK